MMLDQLSSLISPLMFFDFLILVASIGIFLVVLIHKRINWCYIKSEKVPQDLHIIQIKTVEECSAACKKLSKDCEHFSVLGFDCEWVTEIVYGKSVRSPVALLQLASKNGLCCLFQLKELSYIPQPLQLILENDKILKLGVNCTLDATLIEKDYGVEVKGCLDLRHLYPNETGLASLAKNVIRFDLRKDGKVASSNWNQAILTDEQVNYAAKDAWVAVEIYKEWMRTKSKHMGDTEAKKYIDVSFTLKRNMRKLVSDQKVGAQKKTKERQFTRRTPLYDQCWMYAPDGELLCSCDKRKAEWYIQKGLAELECKDPYSIRLIFEPASRPREEKDEFYRQLKQNCCVVCGSKQSYMKHYVVPREYRKHFPSNMKSHQSHDIVLTCNFCHSKAKNYMRKLKEKLALLCDAPIHVSQSVEYKTYNKLKYICKTLLLAGNSIPSERREQLEKRVKEMFNLSHLNDEILQEISLRKIPGGNQVNNHGLKVVQCFKKKENGLLELEELWRKHFLDYLKPQYLPTLWCITHNHKQLEKKHTTEKYSNINEKGEHNED